MTKKLHSVLPALVLLACGLIPLTAAAGPITFTASFTAAGTVNGNPFSGNVMFSLSSDTTLINGGGGYFFTPNTTASVTIQGVGTGTFTHLFEVFDVQGGPFVGFAEFGMGQIIVSLSNPAFATYDLMSAIGPLPSTYDYVNTGQAHGSTLGPIIFDSTSGTPTFTATTGTVPEPGSLVLFGSSLVGLAAAIRRKLKP